MAWACVEVVDKRAPEHEAPPARYENGLSRRPLLVISPPQRQNIKFESMEGVLALQLQFKAQTVGNVGEKNFKEFVFHLYLIAEFTFNEVQQNKQSGICFPSSYDP